MKTCLVIVTMVKGALDKYNIILQLSPKKSLDFYIIRSAGRENEKWLHAEFYILV